MKASIGRRLFFDLVADGLLIGFGSDPPKQIRIKADIGSVPIEDIAALARATCEQLAPTSSIIESKLSQLSRPLAADRSYVVDGEAHALSELAAVVGYGAAVTSAAVIYNFTDDGIEFPTLEYIPGTSADTLYPAIQALFEACGKQPDGLTLARFQLRGFSVFDEDYELFDQPRPPTWDDPVWVERFCTRLASVWRFADAPVPAVHILAWLKQFDIAGFGQEARQLLFYLFRYGYVTEQKITSRMLEEHRRLVVQLGSEPIAVAFQEPGKSESRLAYKLRPTISPITAENAIEVAKRISNGGVVNFICFDDCIGSGETVAKYLFRNEYNAKVDEFYKLYSAGRAKLYVLVYHSDPRGVQRIEEHPAACGAVSVLTLSPLDTTHKVFSADSRIIRDPGRRTDFKTFCEAIGNHLFPANPLGWGDCQWCVAYDYSIPDTSLPVLFASVSTPVPWMALFPRDR